MWEKLKLQFSNYFNGHCCHMRFSIVMTQNNFIYQHSSVFTVNSRFQLLYKHVTIPCTTECLSTILAVLEDGPIKSQNSINVTLLAKGMLLNFLVLSDDVCFHSKL